MLASASRLAPALALAALAGAAPAAAKPAKRAKPPKPACDLAYLPFTPGARWTYAAYTPDNAPDKQGVVIDEPKAFTIAVTSISKAGDATVIKLEESYRKRVVATELRCTKVGLTASPDSFFFAGEPGGGVGMTLGGITRDNKGYAPLLPPAKDLTAGAELYEELKATIVRGAADGSNAKLAGAALELERKAGVGAAHAVESKLPAPSSFSAVPVEIKLTGRTTLEGQSAAKAFNMPEVRVMLWFAPGYGVVKTESSLGRGWELTEYSNGATAPAAETAPTPAR